MAVFRWSERAQNAAIALAEGKMRKTVCQEFNIPERTLYNWLRDPEFSAEVDRLSLMVGVASRAERLRIAKRIVQQRIREQDGFVHSEKDLLEWLKFAQSETDGIKLDLATLIDAAASVAGSGSGGPDATADHPSIPEADL